MYERFQIINNIQREQFRSCITDDLKPSSQCEAAVNKTMSALIWCKRIFNYLDIKFFRILYKTYISPNLEFVVQAWSPYLDKYIKVMEKIQRQAIKLLLTLRYFQYEDRLKASDFSLAIRRLSGDLIKLLNYCMYVHKLIVKSFLKLIGRGPKSVSHQVGATLLRQLDFCTLINKNLFSNHYLKVPMFSVAHFFPMACQKYFYEAHFSLFHCFN